MKLLIDRLLGRRRVRELEAQLLRLKAQLMDAERKRSELHRLLHSSPLCDTPAPRNDRRMSEVVGLAPLPREERLKLRGQSAEYDPWRARVRTLGYIHNEQQQPITRLIVAEPQVNKRIDPKELDV